MAPVCFAFRLICLGFSGRVTECGALRHSPPIALEPLAPSSDDTLKQHQTMRADTPIDEKLMFRQVYSEWFVGEQE